MVRLAPARRGASPPRRHRRHRVALRQLDRDALERSGWRTTLELCENHLRTPDGRLLDVETWWLVEAERVGDGRVEVIVARARSEARAWSRLLDEATRQPVATTV